MPFLITSKGLDTVDRIQLGISYILQLVLVVGAVIFLAQQSWLNAFLTFGILILTLLPKFIRHNYKVFLPVEFDLLAIIFIFASLFLGEIHAYYTRIWWWDIVLHTSSGLLFGLAGFLLVYILNEERKINLTLNKKFMALFAFAFALSIGAVWEIFEFFMDSTFGLSMQKSGVGDTMWDLIVDALGAAAIAVLGYFYIRRQRHLLIFSRMIHRFVQKNPRLFRGSAVRGKT